jgi:hypothetical protein
MTRIDEETTTLRKENPIEFACWLNMLYRCHNPADRSFDRYGGRGLSVCMEWRKADTGFATFFDDMGSRPQSGMSIERKNNALGYSKSNCEWASSKTQNCNRRKPTMADLGHGIGRTPSGKKSALLMYNGSLITIRELCDQCGMTPIMIRERLKRGLTTEQAVTFTTEQMRASRAKNVLASITIN